MKIGILTYHRAYNYGAVLQAYALKEYLSRDGHDVGFVDYWPKCHYNNFRIFNPDTFRRHGFLGKGKYLFYMFATLSWMLKRKHNFQWFFKNKLGVGKEPSYSNEGDVCNEFDVVIYGSDQVWRKQTFFSFKGFDKWYFGSDNVTASKKITYAASMGPVDLSEDDLVFLKEMLPNFDSISVREQSLNKVVNALGYDAKVVLDPVFLLSRTDWQKIITSKFKPPKKKYILFYNLLDTPESIEFVEELSRKTGLKIKELYKKKNLDHFGRRYIKSASVGEFLGLLENAEHVVSNSFHGIAFSIIFQKQFWAVGMGQKAERALTLLKSLALDSRYVEELTGKEQFKTDIDYEPVYETLARLKNNSCSFLEHSVTIKK